jgi:hypothetical protein
MVEIVKVTALATRTAWRQVRTTADLRIQPVVDLRHFFEHLTSLWALSHHFLALLILRICLKLYKLPWLMPPHFFVAWFQAAGLVRLLGQKGQFLHWLGRTG